MLIDHVERKLPKHEQHKIRERQKENLPKIEEISGVKAHTNTWKLNQNISMVTDVFINQKRVNVCEHTTKMA